MSDSSRRHYMHREWNRNGIDSLHKNFGQFRGQAMNNNRFRSQDRMDRFRSFRRNRNGFANHMHIHYSAGQRKQMRSINDEYKKKSQDLYGEDNITLGQYKSQLLALQNDKKTKLQALLTPEQKNEMEKWKKHASEEMQIRAAANLERMKIKLNLNDEQTAKIKSQQTNLRSQMQAIHQNDNLLPYQKKEQMKSLLANREAGIKSVLTPDQLSEFEKMHKHRFGERWERNDSN